MGDRFVKRKNGVKRLYPALLKLAADATATAFIVTAA